MKKVFVAVVALALALTVVAPVATSAQSAAYTFNTNLTIGSRGADVVALQTFLESKGLITIPAGVAKGYFGSLTRSAVRAYQISKGITPTAGYFGPVTRAAVNAEAMVTNPTTPTTPTVPSTGTTEGSLDVKLAPTPANNANVQTQNDVPVYGLEFKAQLANVTVQTVDLQVAVTLSGSAENPSTLINTVKVWDGSTVLATIPVNSTTFTKDQNQVYYIRIPGLNFMVPKDTTKTLTVSFSTNSVDTERVVTIDGYNTSSVRATSGAGISTFYSIDGSGFTRTHTFKRPGTSSLTLSAATSPLRSQNFRISSTNGAEGVSLLQFNVKSETGDSKITTVYASTTASGTAPSTLYLYDGSTLVSSQTVTSSGATVTFSNLNLVVAKDVIKTLTVKADFPSNTTSGTHASSTVSRVVFEKPNGSSADATGSQVTGANQYFYASAPQITLVGTPTISKVSNTNGSTTEMTATFTFNVTALGGTMTKPTSSAFTVYAATNTTNLIAASVGEPVTIPNNNIADGSTAQVTVTATVGPSNITHSGQYGFVVGSTTWTVGSNTITQTYGLDDFKTPATSYFTK